MKDLCKLFSMGLRAEEAKEEAKEGVEDEMMGRGRMKGDTLGSVCMHGWDPLAKQGEMYRSRGENSWRMGTRRSKHES